MKRKIEFLTILICCLFLFATNALGGGFTEDFEQTATGAVPKDWTATAKNGSVGVEGAANEKSLCLNDTSDAGAVTAERKFTATTGETIVILRVRAMQSDADFRVSLRNSSDRAVASVGFDEKGNLYFWSGVGKTNLQKYDANRWYEIKIVARPLAGNFDVLVDDTKRISDTPLREKVETVTGLLLESSVAKRGSQCFDQIAVVTPETTVDLKFLGTIKPRAAKEISNSNWSIGAETLDRDYADYDSYKEYLGNLGAKRVRLQAGWSKVEKNNQGVYDWQWLDHIVDDAISRGLIPWLEFSYGNPNYEGGGTPGLLGDVPSSPEGKRAWENWVTAMTERYKDRVSEWEIWNEPNLNGHIKVEDYTDLFIRTATIVRRIQPNAKIVAIGLAGNDPKYIEDFLRLVKEQNKINLISTITYHPYNRNPDQVYATTEKIRGIIKNYSPAIRLEQGENGAPSTQNGFGALREFPWTELTQTKWNLRRMLGDLGRDIQTNQFTISDLNYPTGKNDKGLLKTDQNKKVLYPKQSYRAMQFLTAIFDDTLTRIAAYKVETDTSKSLSIFGYEQRGTKRQIVTLWQNEAAPRDSTETEAVTFTVPNGNFETPVWVDLRTGGVYEIPRSNFSRNGATFVFKDVPVYDAPILIAEKNIVLPPTQ